MYLCACVSPAQYILVCIMCELDDATVPVIENIYIYECYVSKVLSSKTACLLEYLCTSYRTTGTHPRLGFAPTWYCRDPAFVPMHSPTICMIRRTYWDSRTPYWILTPFFHPGFLYFLIFVSKLGHIVKFSRSNLRIQGSSLCADHKTRESKKRSFCIHLVAFYEPIISKKFLCSLPSELLPNVELKIPTCFRYFNGFDGAP